MKYTKEQIRETVIAELKDRLLIPDVEKLHIVILDAAFKRLPDDCMDWDSIEKRIAESANETVLIHSIATKQREACAAWVENNAILECPLVGDGSIPQEQDCEHHYRIIKGDEVNSFHSAIMRELDVEGLIALRDKLIRRTPDRLPDDTKTMDDRLSTDVSGSLLSFFLWFRANGELYVDKSIEAMIDIYLKESNLR